MKKQSSAKKSRSAKLVKATPVTTKEERPLTPYEAAIHAYMTKTCGAVSPVRICG
jgi:hypothetical protein